jgi:uncharacterized protein YjeT (DUF2065 family)
MSYLGVGGIGLLVAPHLTTRLLGATGPYPRVMLRLVGGFMVALSLVIIGIVRDRVEVLYPVTLLVRVVLLTTLLWVFVDSRDPMFLSLAGIVALGMMLTAVGLVKDRRGHR